MDPWLELPALWPDVHNRLITAVADDLAARVAPRYYVGVEQHTYLSVLDAEPFRRRPDLAVIRTKSRAPARQPAALPDETETGVGLLELDVEVPVRDRVDEWYLEVRIARTGKLVTTIEVLSPTNKAAGAGRRQYLRKRAKVLESKTSLVEIDLLRGGRPMPLSSPKAVDGDYRILISRGRTRPRAKLYVFDVRQPIPRIPIPLLPKDPEPELDLGAVLHALYERARFDLVLDYTKPPSPLLKEQDATWARAIIAGRLGAAGGLV
jgi:hypothetical protein